MFAYIINLKMDLAQNSIPFGRFFLVLWRKNLLSSFAGNWSFFYKFSATSAITKFWIRQKWRLPVNVHGIWFLFIFITYTKKESCTKFYGVLDNFSWSYYVNWFKTIRRSLDTYDIVPTNEHTYANCRVCKDFMNFSFMTFCFMIKRIILSKPLTFGLSSTLT